MKRNRRWIDIAGAMLVCAAASSHDRTVLAQTPAIIAGTTTQLTTDPAEQTDPAVSGSLVVWTKREGTHDDVYFCDITDCAGTERPVADPIPTARRFNDVSGTLIAYTEFVSPTRVVKVYDVASGVTTSSPGTNDANPRIDGHTVVYERGLSPGASIYALDLTSGVESAVFTYSGGPQGINPAVSGTRVVYERNGDIVLHHLATGNDIDVEAGPVVASRPDIDGDIVVYEFTAAGGDSDVAIYRVSTGLTTQIQFPGNQRGPHVSGDVVAFDDDSSGLLNIGLAHIPTGTMQFLGEAAATDRLNDISGHRVVYQSNRNGNNDIYLYEFEVQMPEIDVAPTTHDFGDVNVGASASTIATISNVGALPLTVSNVAFGAGSNAAFTATLPGTVPTILDPGATLDVPVRFTPTAPGVVGATLDIFSDDLDEALVHVALTARGLTVTPTPLQEISDLLAFFDAAVGHGTLFGTGPGNSGKGRLEALRNMIEATGDLLRDGRYAAACEQLLDAFHRVDGNPQPPDFVAGLAAAELRQRIQSLRASLGCP